MGYGAGRVPTSGSGHPPAGRAPSAQLSPVILSNFRPVLTTGAVSSCAMYDYGSSRRCGTLRAGSLSDRLAGCVGHFANVARCRTNIQEAGVARARACFTREPSAQFSRTTFLSWHS